MERHDPRQVGDVSRKGADVVVLACDLQRNGQFRVIVADLHLPGAEGLEQQTATQARLIDVRQQGVHLSSAGQLLFHLVHVLLHLQLLLAQLAQVDSLIQLEAKVALERGLTVLLGLETTHGIGQDNKPAGHHRQHEHDDPARELGQQRPLPRLLGVQTLELGFGVFQQFRQIDAGLTFCRKGAGGGHAVAQEALGLSDLLPAAVSPGRLIFRRMENS